MFRHALCRAAPHANVHAAETIPAVEKSAGLPSRPDGASVDNNQSDHDPLYHQLIDELVNALGKVVRYKPRGASESDTAASEPWISVAEASAYASVSQDTVREWIRSGLLTVGKVGRVIRTRRSLIDALLMRNGTDPTSDAETMPERALEILQGLNGVRNG